MMKRREFSKAASVVLAGSALANTLAFAQAKKPVPGQHYVVLDRRAPVDAPAGTVEVIEFFWYSCPHCFTFDPFVSAWAKKLPKEVAFKRVHVAFRDDFVPQQRLFIALEALGLIDKLHTKVFEAIHIQKLPLNTGAAIVDWVVAQGVDKEKFLAQYNSFGMGAKSSRSKQLQDAYAIDGVPAMGIAGRFYTDVGKAGGNDQSLQVTNYLISEVRAGR
jgi:thiol:disulfide interchange protein DsbA